MALAHRRDRAIFIATLSLLCSAGLGAAAVPAFAAESAALRLIRDVRSLQAQHGSYAPEVLPPLLELGQLYGAGQCQHALDILDLALEVSRRAEGLLNAQQLAIYEPLMSCYVTLDMPAELARAQHYVLLINEAQVGPDDPRLVPALDKAAKRYEEAGLYFSARRQYRRAVEISESAHGAGDLSLVAPLRGLARAYRLEYTYGLALPDITSDNYQVSGLRSNADSARGDFYFDRIGQRALERAVEILREHPQSARERIETLIELGDWHQLAGHHRDAMSIYRDAWRAIQDADLPDTNLLRHPTPLMFRPRTGAALRRTPHEHSGLNKYTVDLSYTVTREGKVEDVQVIESNATPRIERNVVEDLRYQRHRPAFADGEPVETRGLVYRRHVYSKSMPPKPKAETQTITAANK